MTYDNEDRVISRTLLTLVAAFGLLALLTGCDGKAAEEEEGAFLSNWPQCAGTRAHYTEVKTGHYTCAVAYELKRLNDNLERGQQ